MGGLAWECTFYTFGTVHGRSNSTKKCAFSVRQNTGPGDPHSDATDRAVSADGMSSVSSVLYINLPLKPLCGFADQADRCYECQLTKGMKWT